MLLAAPCPMGLSASGRFQKSRCRRSRQSPSPGAWCKKAGLPEERDLWQGRAQICVGLTHAARGNSTGAARLLERGTARVEQYEAGNGPTYGLDLAAVIACAREHAAAEH